MKPPKKNNSPAPRPAAITVKAKPAKLKPSAIVKPTPDSTAFFKARVKNMGNEVMKRVVAVEKLGGKIDYNGEKGKMLKASKVLKDSEASLARQSRKGSPASDANGYAVKIKPVTLAKKKK